MREGTPLDNAKLEALRVFGRTMVAKRGFVDQADLDAFMEAGYTRRHVLDVIAAVTLKTLTNYTNHLADPPVDEAFAPFSWQA